MCFKPLETMALSNVLSVACGIDWTRIAVVRNPYARLYSKFVDKIVKKNEFRPPSRKTDGKNFSSFVGRLAAVSTEETNLVVAEQVYIDEHFRSQLAFCGMRYMKYEFWKFEELSSTAAAFAKKLNIGTHPSVQAKLQVLRPFDVKAEAQSFFFPSRRRADPLVLRRRLPCLGLLRKISPFLIAFQGTGISLSLSLPPPPPFSGWHLILVGVCFMVLPILHSRGPRHTKCPVYLNRFFGITTTPRMKDCLVTKPKGAVAGSNSSEK
jgi:hypothetical protein